MVYWVVSLDPVDSKQKVHFFKRIKNLDFSGLLLVFYSIEPNRFNLLHTNRLIVKSKIAL